jgi:hypothetical protein
VEEDYGREREREREREQWKANRQIGIREMRFRPDFGWGSRSEREEGQTTRDEDDEGIREIPDP